MISTNQDWKCNMHRKKKSTLTEKRSKIVFLVGDSKLFGVNAKRITQKNNVKVRFFPGATT